MRGQYLNRPMQRPTGSAPRKPLPTPLPPPRKGQTAPTRSAGAVMSSHAVPPAPHFGTRFAPIQRTDLHVDPPAAEVPHRSLASLSVLTSLAASVAALALVGWLSTRSPDGLSWSSVKQIFQQLAMSEPAPEEDLPYITQVPMIPSPTAIAKKETNDAQVAERVVMSEPGVEPDSGDDSDNIQRR